ncbi:MAG: hydantoinase B/oxoprolinase family protein [Pirellulales bacterium]
MNGWWEFWIDVGGTFTDCVALSPQGQIVRCKTLSSGKILGRLTTTTDPRKLFDSERQTDQDRLWNGYTLRFLDAAGQIVHENRVTEFGRGNFRLAQPWAGDAFQLSRQQSRPTTAADGAGDLPSCAYELDGGELAPILAVRRVLGLTLEAPLPPLRMRLGTTRGTNALLTRTGAKTALVTTAGLEDVYLIGDQDRPELFALDIRKRIPLAGTAIGVRERVSADGQVLLPLDVADARHRLQQLRLDGWQSLAICLMHAHVFPDHERQLRELAREAGFEEISLSSDVYPLMGLVPRLDTTLLDAYLNPVLRDYLRQIESALGAGSELRMMTSSGGLKLARGFRGADSILSGPAGGVAGVAHIAQRCGLSRAIGFDMGGTSTDVSHYDGQMDVDFEQVKAGVRIAAPMLAIETVAAGGGSICWFDGVKLAVGPQSAGADPGPACYGRGGPLTISDINFYLGRLPQSAFPLPLDRAAVERRLHECWQQVREAGHDLSLDELAEGFFRIANTSMVEAIRNVSIAKGRDPRTAALVGFGGAAGQHVCAVASELGMDRIVLHPDAGILSAVGIGLADAVQHGVHGVYGVWDSTDPADRESHWRRLETEVTQQLVAEGYASTEIHLSRSAELRYAGQDATLIVSLPSTWRDIATSHSSSDASTSSDEELVASLPDRFAQAYQQLYGYRETARSLELVALRVTGVGRRPSPELASSSGSRSDGDPWTDGHELLADHRRWKVRHWQRTAIAPGTIVTGPAVICEATSTTVVDPGWQAELLPGGELLLTATAARAAAALSTDCDPIQLEIFNQRFAAIARQMGITLQRTARSVNVKQRLDFSCALFTARGELVVNAPHIPVHLGAMGETVRCVLNDNPDLSPDDVIVTNDPYRGGSHLPDITVVTPIHDPASGQLLFLTASRAHHAEIGGISPGSMPPDSRVLAEEGVVISNFKLVDRGTARWDQFRQLLTSGPYPSRNVSDNLDDIRAQLAANHQGARDLLAMVQRYSWPVVGAYMNHIRHAAATKARQAIARLPQGRHSFVDHLDSGATIEATIDVLGDRIRIDFTGTSPVQPDNLNANRAIAIAAVLYVVRCLIDEPIPLNQGVLEPVELILPECLLNPRPGANPADSPAVAAGNVETSQRVVDVLLGALNLAAASQGTMNNLLFGDDRFGYYETICGGAGATARRHGADAVHTHMTNTRLTDPEVLESRYPIRLWQFAIRRGSGGVGHHHGGCGVIREMEFLRPLQLSLVTQRRGPFAPYGLEGGAVGQCGINWLVRAQSADGAEPERLPAQAHLAVAAGDRLRIETPGGGGFGHD